MSSVGTEFMEVCKMDRISIVVPCFNEEEALPVYYREMKRVMGELSEVSFEILFVDDGSSDKTLEILKQLNAKDGRCEYLSFSRNFGKEAAIYAGLKHASGDYVATMDVDLQDPPGLLPEMCRRRVKKNHHSLGYGLHRLCGGKRRGTGVFKIL